MKKYIDYGDLKIFPFGTPDTLHGVNPRNMLNKEEWDKLRKKTYKDANYTCEICGCKGKKHPVEAHERMDYDFDNLTQYFDGMIALCPTCHQIVHWSQNNFLLNDGKITKEMFEKQQKEKKEKIDKVNKNSKYKEYKEIKTPPWHGKAWKSDFSKLLEYDWIDELKKEFDTKYNGIFKLQDGKYVKK